jgi:predicted RNA-binding protein YlxR (DUF448 family)
MGCRRVDFKQALVRLAALSGGVRLDLGGKLGGRGGYLHARRECLELFVKAKVSRFSSLGCGVERIERVNLVNLLAAKLAGPTASSKPGPLIK